MNEPLTVRSGYMHSQGGGTVYLDAGEATFQLRPDAARTLARDLLTAAEIASSEAFVVHWARVVLGADEDGAAELLLAHRAFRQPAKPALTPPPPARQHSRLSCLEAIWQVAAALGHPPSSLEWERGDHQPARSTLHRHLGPTWRAVLAAAELAGG